MKRIFILALALAAGALWIQYSISDVSNSLPLPLQASQPVTIEEYRQEQPAPAPSAQVSTQSIITAEPGQQSTIDLQDNNTGKQPNRFFHTEQSARRAGRRKYTSGPCRNYYEGEEWWCK